MRRNVTLLLSVSPLFVSTRFVRAKEKKRWTASGGMRAVTLLALIISCLSSIPTLGQCGTTWVGPASGVWSKGSDWSAGVPTASTNVCIDNGNPQHSAVTLDIAGVQANNLTIDSDDSLSFVNAANLTVFGGTINNAGNITLNSVGNNTDLILAGNDTVTLTGGGKLNLGNSSTNRVYSAGGGGTLINQETIQGAGQLGVGLMSINNSGIIDANVSTALTISPNGGGVTNTGTIEASSGGTLVLVGSYNNAGGTIQAVTSPSATSRSTNLTTFAISKPGVRPKQTKGNLVFSGKASPQGNVLTPFYSPFILPGIVCISPGPFSASSLGTKFATVVGLSPS